MNKILTLAFLAYGVSTTLLNKDLKAQDETNTNEPTTVKYVDLKMYAGLWYEIAKIPNSFQDHCKYGTKAEYILREDGNIDVINSCYDEEGELDLAEGLAKVVDKTSNSKIEVSFVSIFGIHLFWGDYWIIGLDKNYEYAIVGHPERKYGWILSRTPVLSQDKLDEAFNILTAQGYHPSDFEITEQKN
jgi:apolipoprotein D and lipocalin family protein